jgi:hypothetical protein
MPDGAAAETFCSECADIDALMTRGGAAGAVLRESFEDAESYNPNEEIMMKKIESA